MKKKKVYILRDRSGGEIHAELTETGKLTVEMEFARTILDEEELYALFAELGWDLKHEEFQPDGQVAEEIFVPEGATFH